MQQDHKRTSASAMAIRTARQSNLQICDVIQPHLKSYRMYRYWSNATRPYNDDSMTGC